MRIKYSIYLIISLIVVSLVLFCQYKITRIYNFSGIADGYEYQIDYSLKKESRGEWMIDMEVLSKNDDLIIMESQVYFSNPISNEINSKGNHLINHYFEGHVLRGTKLFSEEKMKMILKDSYFEIKWKTFNGTENTEKIYLKSSVVEM